jgi:transcriptional regulator with XRE-family HTH domain
MTNLPQEICLKFKEARKAKGLNQSSLAQMVGCKQSAISMFEGGMVTKLSDETVKKLSEVLEVPLEPSSKTKKEAISIPAGTVAVNGYCPNGDCPSNVPYVVGGRVFYRPSRKIASPTGGIRCACCGEFLEMKCPVCGAVLNDGACCAVCGTPYVTPVLPDGMDVAAYAERRREEIRQINLLAEGGIS